jgi:hypothetical protein
MHNIYLETYIFLLNTTVNDIFFYEMNVFM